MSWSEQMSSLWPALAFLLAGVPMAALLERVGFFEAVAEVLAARSRQTTPVFELWLLAALTTIVLNLDTTIVLLTPLYFRLARRAGTDPLPVVLMPLLLAGLASSVLPISNLTTLIAVEHFDLGVVDVVGHLAPPSLVAIAVGWGCYRRHHPTEIELRPTGTLDRRALTVGAVVVVVLLVGFVVGPTFGIEPWMVALAVDVVLVAVTRWLPWRTVPVATAVLVAIVAGAVIWVVPSDWVGQRLGDVDALGVLLAAGAATVLADAVNNLPALMVGIDGVETMTWGTWAWLLGVNVGAVLLPLGALANLLWARIARNEGLEVPLRRYIAVVVPVALPAACAAFVTLAAMRALAG